MLRNIATFAAVAVAGAAAQLALPGGLGEFTDLADLCTDRPAFTACALSIMTAPPPCLATIDPTAEEELIPCFCNAINPVQDCIAGACGDEILSMALQACDSAAATTTGDDSTTSTEDSESTASETGESTGTTTDGSDSATTTEGSESESSETATNNGSEGANSPDSAATGLVASGLVAAAFAAVVALL